MSETVTSAFTELLRRLELTTDQVKTAQARAKGLRDFFDASFTMAEKTFVIGSYRRGTLIRPERDIDLLAPLHYPTYKARYDNDSSALLHFVRDKLNQDYATTKVSSRRVAVVLDFSVIRAEVVPAFTRRGGGYLIPNGAKGWTSTNPPYHTSLLDRRDSELEGRLKPVVRAMKFWNIANGHHLRSFHVELMTWSMWRSATRMPLMPGAVMKGIGAMRSWLKDAYSDPWADGGRIDAYLAADDRAMVIRMLESDYKAAQLAEDDRESGKHERAIAHWHSVFRSQFPTYD